MKIGLDPLTSKAVATCILDLSVNRGQVRSKLIAQQACKELGADITVDGVFGPKSIGVINSMHEAELVRRIEYLVEQGYRAIVMAHPENQVFLKGWLNRAVRMLTLLWEK